MTVQAVLNMVTYFGVHEWLELLDQVNSYKLLMQVDNTVLKSS
jgi:hypothetical protein